MNYDLICKLPTELLHEMLDYNPLFHKYKREYYKMFISNNQIYNSIILSPNEYKEVEKYNSNSTDVLVENGTITKAIIFQLVSNFNPIHDGMGGLGYQG